MSVPEPVNRNRRQYILNVTLAVMAGQVGCLTMITVLASVFLGLWLDAQFQSRPTMTIILVLVSIPISIIVMLVVAKAAVKRLKVQVEKSKPTSQEGSSLGNKA